MNNKLRIHFLNVGHGDCTIVEEPTGNVSIIDINKIQTPSAREIDPIAYIKELCRSRGTKIVNRLILTHPDMDHMRGIATLLQSGYLVNELWDTSHNKVINEFRTQADQEDWLYYEQLRQGLFNNSVHILGRGSPHSFSWLNGAVTVLSPTYSSMVRANLTGSYNNHSYVLHINHCGFKVILGGDAEREIWEEISVAYGNELKCHVLKASHHGRDSGYSLNALRLMSPDKVILSVGKKPETDAHQKYKQFTRRVWSTRYRGTMVLEINAYGVGSWNFPDRPKQNGIEQIVPPLPSTFDLLARLARR